MPSVIEIPAPWFSGFFGYQFSSVKGGWVSSPQPQGAAHVLSLFPLELLRLRVQVRLWKSAGPLPSLPSPVVLKAVSRDS